MEDKFTKIIQKSGHDFHTRVSKLLTEADWDVTNSPYYNDPDTGKSREIDIIAKKEYIIKSDSFSRNSEKLVVKLFIDCKYIKSPVVFWFTNRNYEKAAKLAMDNPILEDKPEYYIRADNKPHHYISEENREVTRQWTSEQTDVIADAQHKVLKALIFFSENDNDEYYEIRYPVIVVNDFSEFAKRVEGDGAGKYNVINNNFQIETDYSYKNKDNKNITKYFLLDVVSYQLLEDFLKKLEINDIQPLRGVLSYDLRRQEYQNNNQSNQWDDDSDPYE